MKISPFLLTMVLLGLAGLTSACTGGALAATSWPGLTVVEGTAYVAYNTGVFSVNAETGLQKWRFPTEADNKVIFFARPSLTPDGQLLVGSYDNTLYSLDAQNGSENWIFNATGRFIGGPLSENGAIYVPDADNTLYALDGRGQVKWSFKSEQALWAPPASDGERLYVASMDHHLYALDPVDGREIWSLALDGAAVGTPTLSPDGTVYLGTFAKQMVAIDAQTGTVRWRVDTSGWVWSGPAVHNDRLYFGDLEGTFYALDRTTGNTLWTLQPNGAIAGTPLVTEEAIYFTTEAGSLVSVNHDGATRWSQVVGGKIYTAPVAAGDLILVAPMEIDPLLVAYDQNGTQRWTFTPSG